MQENEAVQEEKKKQLYEEGIDAILARAEVNSFTHIAVRFFVQKCCCHRLHHMGMRTMKCPMLVTCILLPVHDCMHLLSVLCSCIPVMCWQSECGSHDMLVHCV